jgi:hypothetical protein
VNEKIENRVIKESLKRKSVPGECARIKNRIGEALPFILFAGDQAVSRIDRRVPAQNIKLLQQANIEKLYRKQVTEWKHRVKAPEKRHGDESIRYLARGMQHRAS